MRRNALEEATLSRMGKKGQDKTYDKKEASSWLMESSCVSQ